jgi:tRNA threonylcarbamoyladenosine modification (KEOPS) complex Cgi121 subunit
VVKRLIPSYINAKVREAEGELRARSLPMEMLLFVAGTMRTDKAIKECGAYDNERFIVFTDNRKGFEKLASEKSINIIKEYRLDFSESIAEVIASVGFLDGE